MKFVCIQNTIGLRHISNEWQQWNFVNRKFSWFQNQNAIHHAMMSCIKFRSEITFYFNTIKSLARSFYTKIRIHFKQLKSLNFTLFFAWFFFFFLTHNFFHIHNDSFTKWVHQKNKIWTLSPALNYSSTCFWFGF